MRISNTKKTTNKQKKMLLFTNSMTASNINVLMYKTKRERERV